MASSGEEGFTGGGGEGEHLCDGFLHKLSGLINKDNVDLILSEQESMLETLEVANEKLSSLNVLSERSYSLHVAEFRTYTQSLMAMKRDLDSVFRRIRVLKTRLAEQYPQAFTEAERAMRDELETERDLDEDR